MRTKATQWSGEEIDAGTVYAMTLEDAHGRLIGDLRVSVTDRCNFRCRYCMPAEGMAWIPREEILSFEEIERLVRLLVGLGVDDVRLTGGEPLVRREFPALVERLRAIEGIEDLSLTTNGYLLAAQAADLVAAGIDRVNVSIDSLARARFFEITRRDALDRVLAGPRRDRRLPRRCARSRSTRCRCPASAATTSLRFCDLARERGFQVRFIEFMPLDGDRAWRAEDVLTGAEVRAMIEEVHPLVERPREPHATARVYGFADGRGEIGFINPVSRTVLRRLQPAAPDRRREAPHLPLLPARDGSARPAARGRRRCGAGRIVRDAVWRKELKHRIDEPGFRPPARTMSAIGG